MLGFKQQKCTSNVFSMYMICSLPALKYFPNEDTHPHFTNEEARCDLFMLKHRAKDPGC